MFLRQFWQVSKRVNQPYNKSNPGGKPLYFEKSECIDTFEVALFTESFIDTLSEEYENLSKNGRLMDFKWDLILTSLLYFYTACPACTYFYGFNLRYNSGNFVMNDLKEGQKYEPYLKGLYMDSNFNFYLPTNQVGVDYEGGGWNFTRYNCSQTVSKGKLLMTPGDLTHISVANPVKKGHFRFLTGKINAGVSSCSMKDGQQLCHGYERLNSAKNKDLSHLS